MSYFFLYHLQTLLIFLFDLKDKKILLLRQYPFLLNKIAFNLIFQIRELFKELMIVEIIHILLYIGL